MLPPSHPRQICREILTVSCVPTSTTRPLIIWKKLVAWSAQTCREMLERARKHWKFFGQDHLAEQQLKDHERFDAKRS